MAYENIDWSLPVRAQEASMARFQDILGQQLAMRQQIELERAKQANAPVDIQSAAENELLRQNMGFAPTEAGMAAIRTMQQTAKDQTYVDEFGQRVTIPSPWRSLGLPSGPQAMPQQGQMPQGDIYNRIMMAESGGDPNAVSPKGAFGLMQLMPETARDPGYGVTPMQNTSPEENMRVGREYFDAMQQKYGGDTAKALAAYNYGPANVDRLLQQGQFPQALPAETRNYVSKIMGTPAQQGMQQPTAQQQMPQIKVTGPMAGTPAAAKMEAEAQIDIQKQQAVKNMEKAAVESKQQNALVNALDQYSVVDRSIEEAIKKTNLLSSGVASWTAGVGGLPASDLEAVLQTVQADSAFAALQEMRNNSPTGGALGSVTEKELALLQNAAGALSQSQSPGQLRKSLQQYRETRRKAFSRVADAYKRDYGYVPADVESVTMTPQQRALKLLEQRKQQRTAQGGQQ